MRFICRWFGIIGRENYNKPKSEDAKQPLCLPDKDKAIKEALKHFGKHFGKALWYARIPIDKSKSKCYNER